MKKTIIFALALALLGGAVYANYGALDTVPAATLLVPYIIVDTNAAGVPVPNGQGYSTLTVVTNVSSAAQLIHVTVFAADSTPVIDFDEVLSGYDVWSINWKDLLTGDFENFDTGSATAPLGATTPGGLYGFWNSPKYTATAAAMAPQGWGPTANNKQYTIPNAQDIDYLGPVQAKIAGSSTGCGFPWGNLSSYASLIVGGLQAPLYPWPNQDTACTATESVTKNWGGWLSTLSAQPLFFYATVDTVSNCNGYFPAQSDYWSYAVPHNTLTGVDFYMNLSASYSESLPTVNIESATGNTGVGFYSADKYLASDGEAYMDNHEPLPTAWAFNYLITGGVSTQVAVWKNYDDFEFDSKGNPTYVKACRPYIYYAFDESENSRASTSQTCPSGTYCLQPEPNVFPFQTQKVDVNATNFDGLMSTNGWMLLVFDPTIYGASAELAKLTGTYTPATPPDFDTAAPFLQTYVFAKYNFLGFSTAVQATVLSNVWYNPIQVMPVFNTNNGVIYE
jgi:hypothetical protein